MALAAPYKRRSHAAERREWLARLDRTEPKDGIGRRMLDVLQADALRPDSTGGALCGRCLGLPSTGSCVCR